MAEESKIEWTTHTFNPWIGCTKVSPGCKNCYAAVDTFARRERSHGRELWGPTADRHRTSKDYWKQPKKWNKTPYYECQACGYRGKDVLPNPDASSFDTPYLCSVCKADTVLPARQRVFCASLADVFDDHPKLTAWRSELFDLIAETPNLDWLLLTKRPQNVNAFLNRALPENVWIGTSVEDQKSADERIPELLKIDARVRFLSCEPLLERVNLGLLGTVSRSISERYLGVWQMIHWVICGGESGVHARPMDPKWAESIRDQCQDAGTPFLFKQWGEWHWDGDVILERPDTPVFYTNGMSVPMYRIGKRAAGRLLDGREWNEYPKGE